MYFIIEVSAGRQGFPKGNAHSQELGFSFCNREDLTEHYGKGLALR